jgi:hypothetical protein
MSRSLLPHPIALVFPDIDADTFNDLVESMRTRGYDALHPIVLFEGKILDGRNRYRAAQVARVEPTFREFEGTIEDAAEFSLRENLHRRHLTPGQRALIVDDLVRFLPAERPKSYKAQTFGAHKCAAKCSGDVRTEKRIERVAAQHAVSPRVVVQARELRRIAPPEVVQQVKEGRQSLGAALRVAKALAVPPEAQNASERLDATGRAIPDGLSGALIDGREKFQGLVRELQAVKRAIKAICGEPIGRMVNWQAVETDLDNVMRALRYAAPYTACPLGDPCDADCRLCRGSQWITESQWENVPRELKGAGA